MENYFSINLKFLLKKLKISQVEFSESIGKQRSVIGSYIRNETQPNIETLLKIAGYFDIMVDSIVCLNLPSLLENVAISNKKLLKKIIVDNINEKDNYQQLIGNIYNDREHHSAEITNQIKTNINLIRDLYDRIVDICLIISENFSQSFSDNLIDKASEILRKSENIDYFYDKGSYIYEDKDLLWKIKYNEELKRNIKVLHTMFFDQFRILYLKLRNLK